MTSSHRPLALPTRRGVAVVAVLVVLLVVALVTTTPELVPLLVALAVPVLAAPGLATRRARRAAEIYQVRADAVPPVAPVGAAVNLVVTVVSGQTRGRGVRQAMRATEGRWQRSTIVAKPARSGVLAPPGLLTIDPGTAGLRVPVPTSRRGIFVLPADALWVLDPFSLFAAPGPAVTEVRVAVYPSPTAHASWPRSTAMSPGGDEAPVAVVGARREGLGDLVGLRPYVEGDRLTLLHWPARARYGAWFVRQFGTDEVPTDHLMLDDRVDVHRRRDFERLLSTVMGMIEEALRTGRTVELSTLTGRSEVFAPVPVGLERARMVLAGLLPRAVTPNAPPPGTVVLTTATGAPSLRALADGSSVLVAA